MKFKIGDTVSVTCPAPVEDLNGAGLKHWPGNTLAKITGISPNSSGEDCYVVRSETMGEGKFYGVYADERWFTLHIRTLEHPAWNRPKRLVQL